MYHLFLAGYLEINIADIVAEWLSYRDEASIIIDNCKILSGLNYTKSSDVIRLKIIHEQGIQDHIYLTLKDGTIYDDDPQTLCPSGYLIAYGFVYGNDEAGDLSGLIEEAGPLSSKSSIFAYKLNDERNKVDKLLIFDKLITGDFRSVINVSSLELDIQNYSVQDTFNYVYIFALNRFYYVDSVELKTNKIATLTLSEDVLMSHKELIRQQEALINRSYSKGSKDIDDNENLTYGINPEITTITITPIVDIFNLNNNANRCILTVVRK